MRDGVAPGVGTGSGIAGERVALTCRGPVPEGAKLGAAGVRVVGALLEPGAKLGAAGVRVVAASPEPGAKDGGVGATVVSSGVAGGFGTGALRRAEDAGVGTGYAPLGEDDGICDESAWRVRNDLRAADPGANDGGGVGAERLGNSEEGSRWG